MSVEGSITKSNFIDYDKALNVGLKLMKRNVLNMYEVKFNNAGLRTYPNKEANFGFYIIVAINTGLRIGDILNLKREDFERGFIEFREQKTSKAKKVKFNEIIIKQFKDVGWFGSDGDVFFSQKNSIYSRQQINRKLKQVFKSTDKNISSHSLRKTFGRRVYENNNETEKSLVMLSQIFNHSSIAQTRAYLDITQEEIEDIYMNL